MLQSLPRRSLVVPLGVVGVIESSIPYSLSPISRICLLEPVSRLVMLHSRSEVACARPANRGCVDMDHRLVVLLVGWRIHVDSTVGGCAVVDGTVRSLEMGSGGESGVGEVVPEVVENDAKTMNMLGRWEHGVKWWHENWGRRTRVDEKIGGAVGQRAPVNIYTSVFEVWPHSSAPLTVKLDLHLRPPTPQPSPPPFPSQPPIRTPAVAYASPCI